MAFFDVIFRLSQFITDKLQRGGLVEVFNRENRSEYSLQSCIGPLLNRNVRLQKLLVRSLLNLDQIGNVNDLFNLAEGAADTKITCDLRLLSHFNLVRHQNKTCLERSVPD